MPLIIAGERSGVGKTTVTLALLAALQRRSPTRTQSFKVGPDYIDPMFHTFVTDRPSRNLDPILTSETYVRDCFQRHCRSVDYAVVEGVMGLFDGVTGKDDWASTAHVARLLDIPIALVLNCSSTSRSIAAIIHGYTTFDPRLKFAGVILNRVGSDRHLELLRAAIEPLQIPVLGVLRRQDEIAIPDRHLGLIPTAELPELRRVIDRLAELGETCFDWERLRPVLEVTERSPCSDIEDSASSTVRLAVARDRAFNFYYADNFDLLKAAGAELIEWSPMTESLPEGVQGLYFGGGFPEVFAEALRDNHAARNSVKTAIASGMPTYAECGGLMYLCDRIVDFESNAYPMVGIFPTTAQMGKRLTLGYRRAIAQHTTPFVTTGDTIWGHEFHRSHVTPESDSPLFQMQNYDNTLHQTEGWHHPNVHASYLHLHFGGQLELLNPPYQQFLQHCRHAFDHSK